MKRIWKCFIDESRRIGDLGKNVNTLERHRQSGMEKRGKGGD